MTKYIITAGILLLTISFQLHGQVTQDNNNPVITNFVGFDLTSGIPLPIENRGFPEINLSSNFNTKMYFREQPTWNGLNGITRTDVQRTLMSLQGQSDTLAWSIFHLYDDADGHVPSTMRRDWFNLGVSYSSNFDFMYTGMLERPKADGEDLDTDAVIAWGCQDGSQSQIDNFRFLFIQPTNMFPSSSATSEQGRETMRITPVGNVGIGDFSHMPNGLDEQPTQRLDVDGTARLRQMPNDSMDVIITGVYAEDPGVDGDFVLNYATLEDIGLNLCDWDIVNSGADVATGYPGACVEGKVLIGSNVPAPFGDAKVYMTKDYSGVTLQVDATTSGSNAQYGATFYAENSTIANTGLLASGASSAIVNYGIQAFARDANSNFGVDATASHGRINYGVKGFASHSFGSINFGVHGLARGSSEPMGTNNVGVYGQGIGPAIQNNFGGYFLACGGEKTPIAVYGEVCDTTSGVAGYFAGSIQVSQSPIALSDESIKTDMTDIENSLDLINQLNPKQYYFNNEVYGHLRLDNSKSYGFSAQEVQEVLPDIVEEFHHPAKFDTTGELISPSEDLLGIQYQEFIAILTAGIKEQQAQISEQEQTIDDLQESLNNQNDLIAQMMDQMDALANQVNDCCDGGFKYNPVNEDHGNLDEKANPNGNILEQNIPNPFRSQTNISYTLEQGGKVLLNIFDKTGKPITTLVEAEQQAGNYRYEWDASGLPAGLYHYALYVDGELLVKKAIKLQD